MWEQEFPILRRKINGQRLVYLDNASTTQKPRSVIEAISNFYKNHNANIHRGIYTLSLEATKLYEEARDKIREFLHAQYREEIIFTSGATESINLVVWTWGRKNIHRGDEILLSEMEHHSNLVPWQILAKKKGAKLKFIPISPTYHLQLTTLNKLITPRTKILSLTHVSNVLGTINPVEKIIKAAHRKGAVVLVDGAQAGGHIPIDVQKLGADFYVLSGHKMYGPTGVGVLYGRKELLEAIPPYQTGGHMIKKVELRDSGAKPRTESRRASGAGVGSLDITWNDLPYKFEAGTANIAEVIGLGQAVDFLNSPLPSSPSRGEELKERVERIRNHESELTKYALSKLKTIPGFMIYGPQTSKDRIGVISFNVRGIPPHDLASLLDEKGIAIRTGHHCAMPLHEKLGVEATVRMSLGIYNNKRDIDALIDGINRALSIFVPERSRRPMRNLSFDQLRK